MIIESRQDMNALRTIARGVEKLERSSRRDIYRTLPRRIHLIYDVARRVVRV